MSELLDKYEGTKLKIVGPKKIFRGIYSNSDKSYIELLNATSQLSYLEHIIYTTEKLSEDISLVVKKDIYIILPVSLPKKIKKINNLTGILSNYLGEQITVEVSNSKTYIGTLKDYDGEYIELNKVEIKDTLKEGSHGGISDSATYQSRNDYLIQERIVIIPEDSIDEIKKKIPQEELLKRLENPPLIKKNKKKLIKKTN